MTLDEATRHLSALRTAHVHDAADTQAIRRVLAELDAREAASLEQQRQAFLATTEAL